MNLDELRGTLGPQEALMPTGTCFDDALDYLVYIGRHEGRPALERLTLVHGICHHEETGKAFAHAWVEEGPNVIHCALWRGEKVYATLDKAEYYAEQRIEDTTRYTPLEARAENDRTVHFGPWVERYQALCLPRSSR